MTIPGFTAQASLDQAASAYRGGLHTTMSHASVQPAAIKPIFLRYCARGHVVCESGSCIFVCDHYFHLSDFLTSFGTNP